MDKDPEASIKLNVDATKALAEAMSKHIFTEGNNKWLDKPNKVVGRLKKAFWGFDSVLRDWR